MPSKSKIHHTKRWNKNSNFPSKKKLFIKIYFHLISSRSNVFERFGTFQEIFLAYPISIFENIFSVNELSILLHSMILRERNTIRKIFFPFVSLRYEIIFFEIYAFSSFCRHRSLLWFSPVFFLSIPSCDDITITKAWIRWFFNTLHAREFRDENIYKYGNYWWCHKESFYCLCTRNWELFGALLSIDEFLWSLLLFFSSHWCPRVSYGSDIF